MWQFDIKNDKIIYNVNIPLFFHCLLLFTTNRAYGIRNVALKFNQSGQLRAKHRDADTQTSAQHFLKFGFVERSGSDVRCLVSACVCACVCVCVRERTNERKWTTTSAVVSMAAILWMGPNIQRCQWPSVYTAPTWWHINLRVTFLTSSMFMASCLADISMLCGLGHITSRLMSHFHIYALSKSEMTLFYVNSNFSFQFWLYANLKLSKCQSSPIQVDKQIENNFAFENNRRRWRLC